MLGSIVLEASTLGTGSGAGAPLLEAEPIGTGRLRRKLAGKRSSWVAKLGLRGRRLVIGRSWKAAAGGSGAGGPTKAGAGGAEARGLNWRDRRSLMVGGAGGEALVVKAVDHIIPDGEAGWA